MQILDRDEARPLIARKTPHCASPVSPWRASTSASTRAGRSGSRLSRSVSRHMNAPALARWHPASIAVRGQLGAGQPPTSPA